MRTGVLILAAGAAFRMNQPKMLLAFGSTSILANIIVEIKAIKPRAICLVTGYYHKEIIEAVDVSGLMIVHNEYWREGMASSISKGVHDLIKKHPHLESIIIVVSDQPYLNRKLLNDMVTKSEKSKKGMVAAKYGKINGTPVLFDKRYFKELLALKGDAGARSLLKQYDSDVVTVEFSLGEIDIDTVEDYEKLSRKTKK